MIYSNILEAIGHTPVIRLSRMTGPDMAQVLVKFEGLNVGGSIKTRTAYNMILDAEKKGQIGPDTIIVEPTSGNQGIGLALVGAVRGYRRRDPRLPHRYYYAGFRQRGTSETGAPLRSGSDFGARCGQHRGLYRGMPAARADHGKGRSPCFCPPAV